MRSLAQSLEPWVLAYLLNSLWQIPLVFCAALAAARIARPAGPRTEHRIWVGALIFETVLPACHFHLNQLWQQAWSLVLWFRAGSSANGETRVILGGSSPVGIPVSWLPPSLLAVIAAAYVCALLYFAGRLAWGVWTTESMRRNAVPLHLPEDAARKFNRFERLIGINGSTAHIASSSAISGPATVGIRRPTMLIPPGFLDHLSAEEVDAVFAHEIAHMRRGDFAKNLFFGILSLPAAYHPLLALSWRRLAESREMICDTIAADAIGGRESYARSLLRLASLLSDRPAPRVLHAIGIFDANIFERRVMNLTRKSLHIKGARRFAIIAACALLACATCASALALRMEVNEPKPQNPAPNPKSVNVKPNLLQPVTKVQPVFPAEEKEKAKASKKKIDGSVILAVTISREGTVQDIHVTKSLGVNFDQSALDAVRQWVYKPYLLNGEPIEVKTSVTITYTLKP
jgi:TonB family protein